MTTSAQLPTLSDHTQMRPISRVFHLLFDNQVMCFHHSIQPIDQTSRHQTVIPPPLREGHLYVSARRNCPSYHSYSMYHSRTGTPPSRVCKLCVIIQQTNSDDMVEHEYFRNQKYNMMYAFESVVGCVINPHSHHLVTTATTVACNLPSLSTTAPSQKS